MPEVRLRDSRPRLGLIVQHLNPGAYNPDVILRRCGRWPDPVFVTTWRDWRDVRESWRRVSWPSEQEDEQDAVFSRRKTEWYHMVKQRDPFIVTFEQSYEGLTRDERLGRLGQRLGIPLTTDWRVGPDEAIW